MVFAQWGWLYNVHRHYVNTQWTPRTVSCCPAYQINRLSMLITNGRWLYRVVNSVIDGKLVVHCRFNWLGLQYEITKRWTSSWRSKNPLKTAPKHAALVRCSGRYIAATSDACLSITRLHQAFASPLSEIQMTNNRRSLNVLWRQEFHRDASTTQNTKTGEIKLCRTSHPRTDQDQGTSTWTRIMRLITAIFG